MIGSSIPIGAAVGGTDCSYGSLVLGPGSKMSQRAAGLRPARGVGAFVNIFPARGRRESFAPGAQNCPSIQNARRLGKGSV